MSTATETPYRFTVSDYEKLGRAGIFDEDDRVELLDGEIIIMAPVGNHHVKAVRKLNRRMNRIYGDLCLVDCQNPFILNNISEPQPDILLLHPRMEESEELPGPSDLFLVVEVAESSLGYDRGRKLQRYAAGGVPEVWIVNLVDRLIEVFREPTAEGYRVKLAARPGESLAPQAFADTPIAADDIFPKA
jgi:Uma2 family endonuclease